VIASDKKRLVVDAFARYRIDNALKFYQSVTNEVGANARIGATLEASLRRVLGAASFKDVVSDKREDLMRIILSQVNTKAKDFGVEIIDVRIKRVDLPEANMQAIYKRMQTERQKEAAEYRAQGERDARGIRADADREVTVIKAKATGESERVRGQGDAQRNRIYAEAYNKDPDFFAFYRSMQAYEAALQAGDTRLLLSPDSQFFQYFNDANGKAPPAPASPPANGDRAPSAPSASPGLEELPEGEQHSGTPPPASGADAGGVAPDPALQ
jgi:membrane protease subunit HflC